MNVEWQRLTAEELSARAAAGGAVALIPVASLEQHGPHLATGVDMVLTEAVARETALRMTVPAAVTPVVWTGLAEHHMDFGGTVTLDAAAFHAVLRGVARSAARCGFGRIALLNGHGGNAEAVALAASELAGELGVAVAGGTCWHIAADAIAPLLEDQPGLMHACEAETSLMMHLAPSDVRTGRLAAAHGPLSTRPPGQPAALVRRRSFRAASATGVIGDARRASAAKGEAILAAAAERLAAVLSDPAVWA